MEHSQQNDLLNLSQQPNIVSQLIEKQQIKFSCLIKKINQERMIQQRIFLLTNESIYNISKKSGIIKSLVSKLISLQSKYTIKRRIALKSIYGITLSKSKQNGQFILHVNDQYDYRYCTQNYQKKVQLLKKVCQIYSNLTGKKLAFYFKDQIVLIDYATRKCDLKNKIDRKPRQQAVYLTCQDFQQYELPDLNYKLEYTKNSVYTNIGMKNFKPLFQIQKLQNNIKYFTITTTNLPLKTIEQLLKFKHKYLLHPQFIFSTKNKIQLITPFMIGGNLGRKLRTSVRISNQLAYFYIAQLISIIQEMQKYNVIYGNFCLENIYINENGYLRIVGIDKTIRKIEGSTQFYDIVGYLPYIAPQMILVKGYNLSVNLWKLGICAYKLLQGTFPFEGKTSKAMYFQILNKHLKPDLPQFLQRLLERDPSKRITIEQLKDNVKFRHILWKQLKQQKIPAPYQPDISSWKGNLPSVVQLQVL